MFEEVEAVWDAIIRENKLDHVADKLSPLLDPALGLNIQPCDEKKLPLASSKLGGHPDLLPETQWPVWNNTPLSFIAQINLSEIAGVPFAACLPQGGLLSFFYHASDQPFGSGPEDKGSAKVIYTPNPDAALRCELPLDMPKQGIFSCCSIRYSGEPTLPAYDSLPVKKLGLSEADRLLYMEARSSFRDFVEQRPHRLLGQPDQFQNDMSIECHLASSGINCHTPAGYEAINVGGLDTGAEDWRLLLEIGEDDNGMVWGDGGSIYFWIRKQDLAAQNFDNVWLILQSC